MKFNIFSNFRTRQSRQSVVPKKSAGQGINIVETITKVLSEMQRLEDNIKRADGQRAQAESELLEVVLLKDTADEALDNLIDDIGKKVVVLDELAQNLRTISDSVYVLHCFIHK